jgi:hypothetical protein
MHQTLKTPACFYLPPCFTLSPSIPHPILLPSKSVVYVWFNRKERQGAQRNAKQDSPLRSFALLRALCGSKKLKA